MAVYIIPELSAGMLKGQAMCQMQKDIWQLQVRCGRKRSLQDMVSLLTRIPRSFPWSCPMRITVLQLPL